MSARWAGGSGLPFGPRVWALADKEVDAPIDGVRMDEAKQIARLLRQMVADEWQTLDREVTDTNGTETYRPVTYSDICILKPTRTGLWMLERALEDQDVPYRLESASLIFETQEIKDLLNCLKAVDDPADQVAICRRSPFPRVRMQRRRPGQALRERRTVRLSEADRRSGTWSRERSL